MHDSQLNSFQAAFRRQVGYWGVLCILVSQIASSPGVLEWGFHVRELMSHYKEHQQLQDGLTFCDFLAEHYGGNKEAHETEHDHSELPFKGEHQHHILSFSLQLIPNEILSFELSNPTKVPSDLIAEIPHFLTADLIVDLWQPPRLS
jgi:hypothetical protein